MVQSLIVILRLMLLCTHVLNLTVSAVKENDGDYRSKCTSFTWLCYNRCIISEMSCHDDDDLEDDKYSRFKNLPTTQTSFGDLHGRIEMFNDNEVLVFHGIRYAKPPVGERRFKKPEPLDVDTVKTFGLQSSEKVACVQPKNFLTKDELSVSEDCLHLNVWVPLTKQSSNDINLNRIPVMIWIHGGSFHFGSGNQNDFNGIVLSAVGQVIVVTLNYRLGFFGFLNAEHESAPGNMGLYDQGAALRWVRENIDKFGGDPESITVFGESAGGLSVGLLAVSPLTRNLFQRAIIESGSPYSPLRPEPKAEVFRKSLLFSKALNCSSENEIEFSESAMECLRTADYMTIDDYGRNEVMHSQILPNPMFGDVFIPANVHVLMNSSENINQNLDVLIGINRDEGFVFVAQQMRNLFNSTDSLDGFTKDDVYPLVAKLLNGRPVDPLAVTNFYFQNITTEWDSTKVLNTIIDLYGDLYINCPVYFLAKKFTEILGYEHTFSYLLSEASSQPYMPVCKPWSKVCHGDELVLIFGVPLRNDLLSFNDSDKVLSKYFVRLWSNFARTGLVKRFVKKKFDANITLDSIGK